MINPSDIVDRSGDTVTALCTECKGAIYTGEPIRWNSNGDVRHGLPDACPWHLEYIALMDEMFLLKARVTV